MAADPLELVRSQIGERIAEIHRYGTRLSPLDLHARMNAIRALAAEHGMVALERLARNSAERALRPGHRVAMRSCLEHMGDAIASRSTSDCTAILAAVAVRLH
jgi:hypothetical protein